MSTTDTNNQTNISINLQTPYKTLSADFVLDGITVIAGENDTGKSIVNKILNAVYYSAYQTTRNIDIELFREVWIYKEILSQFEKKNYGTPYYLREKGLTANLRKISKTFSSLSSLLTEHITIDPTRVYSQRNRDVSIETLIKEYRDHIPYIAETIARIVLEKYNSSLKEEVFKDFLNRQIKELQICGNSVSVKAINLSIRIQNSNTDISINNTTKDEIETENLVFERPEENIYFDNSIFLDAITDIGSNQKKAFSNVEHISNFVFLLGSPIQDDEAKLVAHTKRFKYILDKLDEVCKGELKIEEESYYSFLNKELVPLSHIPSGKKVFTIIKTLLLNGSITNNRIMILEEPEVHLHPKWQLLLAEIIVLLQKEFNLQVLLNTHSPYFLEAIEVYSGKYNIKDKCKYYLAENSNNHSSLRDVTNETEEIYKQFASPFQILENEKYKNE